MSFYYLFIPTWIFTILIYTLLAKKYGAKKTYPEAEAKEKEFNELVEEYQEKVASEEQKTIKDTSLFSKILKVGAYTSLAITLILAINVMFGSDDKTAYEENREIFYSYGFVFAQF